MTRTALFASTLGALIAVSAGCAAEADPWVEVESIEAARVACRWEFYGLGSTVVPRACDLGIPSTSGFLGVFLDGDIGHVDTDIVNNSSGDVSYDYRVWAVCGDGQKVDQIVERTGNEFLAGSSGVTLPLTSCPAGAGIIGGILWVFTDSQR